MPGDTDFPMRRHTRFSGETIRVDEDAADLGNVESRWVFTARRSGVPDADADSLRNAGQSSTW
jgi:hypothetical protein